MIVVLMVDIFVHTYSYEEQCCYMCMDVYSHVLLVQGNCNTEEFKLFQCKINPMYLEVLCLKVLLYIAT